MTGVGLSQQSKITDRCLFLFIQFTKLLYLLTLTSYKSLDSLAFTPTLSGRRKSKAHFTLIRKGPSHE